MKDPEGRHHNILSTGILFSHQNSSGKGKKSVQQITVHLRPLFFRDDNEKYNKK